MLEYENAKYKAYNCNSFYAVDLLLKEIELNPEITDRQYYNIKKIAIETAYINEKYN